MMLTDKSKLFRKEAINFKDKNLTGKAIITSPTSFKLLTVILVVFIVFFVTLSVTATYARQELVVGRLVPQGQFSKLVALKAGTLTTVEVKEGQYVNKGDLLLAVESPYFDQQGKNVNTIISSQYADTLDLLDDSLKLEHELSQQYHQKLLSDIAIKQQEQVVTDKLLLRQEQKVSIIQEELNDYKRLEQRGQLTKSQLKLKQKELLDEEIALQRLALQKQNLASTINELTYQQSTLAQKTLAKEKKTDLEKAAIKRSLYNQRTQNGYQLRAPISGYVTALVVKPGEQVSQDAPLLSITSANATLEAELFVPTKAIGFISEQSEVRLRYVAFPYQKFGSYQGRVKSISKTILFAKEHQHRSGLNKPVYQVIVELADQSITYRDVKQKLQPGMEVQAYLMGEKRSLLEWLFEPLLAFDRQLWS